MFVHVLVAALLPTSFALFNYNQQATYGSNNVQHPNGKQANARRAKAKNLHRNNAYQPKHVAKDIYQRPKQVNAYAPPTHYSREPKQASAYGPRRVAKQGPKRINAYEPKYVAKNRHPKQISKESYRPQRARGNNAYMPKRVIKHPRDNSYEPMNPPPEPVEENSYEPVEEPSTEPVVEPIDSQDYSYADMYSGSDNTEMDAGTSM